MLGPIHRDIAEGFAPIIAQKIDLEWPAADEIVPIDYAGALSNIADNPAKLFEETGRDPRFRIDDPCVYFSTCETTTHYFLLYAVYHVMDWWKRFPATNLYDLIRDRLDEHIHDLEGALFVVRKEPEPTVDAVITIAHRDFYLYSQQRQPTVEGNDAAGNFHGGLAIVRFSETVDGYIWLDKDSGRVKLYVESKGHGIHGDHRGWGGGDEIWYYRPAGVQTDPGALNSMDAKRVLDYRLVDLCGPGGLWERRFDPKVLRQKESGQWALVCRKKLTQGPLIPGLAHAPWSWEDRPRSGPMGEIATDPAHLILRYAQGWGPVSTLYLVNPYLGINP